MNVSPRLSGLLTAGADVVGAAVPGAAVAFETVGLGSGSPGPDQPVTRTASVAAATALRITVCGDAGMVEFLVVTVRRGSSRRVDLTLIKPDTSRT